MQASQTDHVGRTGLAKFCGSRDDSLSWNLSRVKQYGAIRADDMDHKTGAILEIQDWPDVRGALRLLVKQ